MAANITEQIFSSLVCDLFDVPIMGNVFRPHYVERLVAVASAKAQTDERGLGRVGYRTHKRRFASKSEYVKASIRHERGIGRHLRPSDQPP